MEKRKWTNIKAVETEIIKMRKAGRTRQEIADALGLEKYRSRTGSIGITGNRHA
jgi:transcriptional regulator